MNTAVLRSVTAFLLGFVMAGFAMGIMRALGVQ